MPRKPSATITKQYNTRLSIERYDYLMNEAARRNVYMIDILNEAIDLHKEKHEKGAK